MPEIDGIESKEQHKHKNHCAIQKICLGLFERDAFILDQCAPSVDCFVERLLRSSGQ